MSLTYRNHFPTLIARVTAIQMAIEGVVPVPKLSRAARSEDNEVAQAGPASGIKRSRKLDNLAEHSQENPDGSTSLTPQLKRLKMVQG